jgi:drug/metabolite transporter (DMT)-like permease
VLSAGTFGASGVFASALISSGWSPAAAAIARLAGSAIVLAVPAVLQLHGRWSLLRREAGRVLTFGLVAIAGNQLCYFNAIESIPIGLAVLLEYLGVVLVVGWLWLARGHRPGWLTVAGTATAITGLVFFAGLAEASQLSPIGLMWGFLQAVGLAVYFVLSAAVRETEETLPALVLAWAGLCVGGLSLALAGWGGAVPVTATASDVDLFHRHVSWIVPVLELSLASGAIAYVVGVAAARRLGAKLASFIGMAEILFAVMYAWLLLGQLPSAAEFAGGAFLLTGVVLVRVDENRRDARPTEA